MYITPRQKQRYFWTTIILLIGLPLTVFASIAAIRYFTGASGDDTPTNVVVTNLTSNSVSITWSTDSQSAGSITVNGGKGDSAPFIDIRGVDRRNTHHVDIVDLEPSKDYSFVILSNGTRYTDEKGKAFKFRTSPVTGQTPVPKPVYGSVDGGTVSDVLIYVTVDDQKVYPASSATTSSGKWIVDLSALRDPTSNSLVTIEQGTNINIIAKGGSTLGGVLSGTYAQLVDNEGQLKTPIAMSDVPIETLFASIPQNARLSNVVVSQPTPQEPVDEEPVDEEPVDEEPEPTTPIAVGWEDIPGTRSDSSVSFDTSKTVSITNITDTGFSVIWGSAIESEGSIKYGTSPSALDLTALDERDSTVNKGKYLIHSVNVDRLQPETTYYFEIYNDLTAIRNGNAPFSVKTFKTLDAPPEFKTITGDIKNYPPNAQGIIKVKVNSDSTVGSTLVDSNGGWVVTLGDIRKTGGEQYYPIKESDKIDVDILTTATVKGLSTTYKTSEENKVELVASSSTKRTVIKIARLSNYGVYGVGEIVNVVDAGGTGGGGTDIDTGGSTETPKASLSTPLIYTLVIAFSSIFIGIYTYIKMNKRYSIKEDKEYMRSHIN